MGAQQRRKGHDYERRIASQLREDHPDIAGSIRRGQQGAGAIEPDVLFPGLWIECGERHLVITQLYDGQWHTFRICRACEQIRRDYDYAR